MKINTILSALELNKEYMLQQNIQGEAIIINQNSTEPKYERVIDNNTTYDIYHFQQKGIGKSRNEGILLSNADIILLADDDEIFEDEYIHLIKNAYNIYRDYDVILFNVRYKNKPDKITDITEVNLKNCYKYGAVNISFKLNSIRKKDIFFSNNFGGGAIHGSGEDSKFIVDCLNNNLKVIALPINIANLDETSESTWFKGFDDKFFIDKGALFSSFRIKTGFLFGLIMIFLRFRNKGEQSLIKKYKLYINGYINYRK
ncbi:glycosyltransferase [Macrococcoides canis]|uniref:glycosyltransferase family A protein n=1 Tax=Macrococcoides canis TaxID=1855823 RepID=UPI0013E8FA66|nr:glycosyltransferase family A protein [Macrococcus canis]QIH75555.1 glycosyltransferase [Macrococcus canis]